MTDRRTNPTQPARSGWCPPDQHHPSSHAACQRWLNRGQLPGGCQCPDHGGHQQPADTAFAASLKQNAEAYERLADL